MENLDVFKKVGYHCCKNDGHIQWNCNTLTKKRGKEEVSSVLQSTKEKWPTSSTNAPLQVQERSTMDSNPKRKSSLGEKERKLDNEIIMNERPLTLYFTKNNAQKEVKNPTEAE
ncbi:hypothetical protein NPIL_623081 [Nephila pilipes]|uniref:Uncharacterized protein n=1 Tax=Nephila pilipes TaxID=299642 RepID=A0A8X6TA25_NEPPI|nr:hypothetical protein NPIL_623081 [Nephila pilipes]